MTDSAEVLKVYTDKNHKPVATIVLNGYNIDAEGILGYRGLRSFKVVQGDLWDAWNAQDILLLHDDQAQVVQVRIAALPVEADSMGLLEFL